MNCNNVLELLDQYIDDFLGDDEKEKVEQHLEECENCKKEYDFRIAMIDSIKAIDEPFPDGLNEKIIAGFANLKQEKPAPKIFKWKWTAVSAVAAVLIIAFSYNLTNIPFLKDLGSSTKKSSDSIMLAKSDESGVNEAVVDGAMFKIAPNADEKSVADTSVADTSVADTSVADTSVADTSVADTTILTAEGSEGSTVGAEFPATSIQESPEPENALMAADNGANSQSVALSELPSPDDPQYNEKLKDILIPNSIDRNFAFVVAIKLDNSDEIASITKAIQEKGISEIVIDADHNGYYLISNDQLQDLTYNFSDIFATNKLYEITDISNSRIDKTLDSGLFIILN